MMRFSVVLMGLLASTAARAEVALPTLDYSLRNALFSHDPGFAYGAAQGGVNLWLRSDYRPSDQVRYHAEGWALATTASRYGSRQEFQLREAWMSWRLDDLELRAGRQIIVWGRADKLNPTDRISTRNYTLPFASDDDERLGSFMVRAAVPVGSFGRLDVIWSPEFLSNTLLFGQPSSVAIRDQQASNFDPSQGAIRYDVSGGRLDWSVSYSNGLDRNPDIAIATPSFIALQHYRIETAGVDAAGSFGGFGLRGEASFTRTGNDDGKRADIKHSFLYFVAGADKEIADGVDLNMQFIFKHTFNYSAPSSFGAPTDQILSASNNILSEQTGDERYGVSTRLAWHGFNDAATAEISSVLYPKFGEAYVSGKAAYAITDSIQGFVGFRFLNGDAGSTFGELNRASVGFGGIKVGY
jgi:hypothetical protein